MLIKWEFRVNVFSGTHHRSSECQCGKVSSKTVCFIHLQDYFTLSRCILKISELIHESQRIHLLRTCSIERYGGCSCRTSWTWSCRSVTVFSSAFLSDTAVFSAASLEFSRASTSFSRAWVLARSASFLAYLWQIQHDQTADSCGTFPAERQVTGCVRSANNYWGCANIKITESIQQHSQHLYVSFTSFARCKNQNHSNQDNEAETADSSHRIMMRQSATLSSNRHPVLRRYSNKLTQAIKINENSSNQFSQFCSLMHFVSNRLICLESGLVNTEDCFFFFFIFRISDVWISKCEHRLRYKHHIENKQRNYKGNKWVNTYWNEPHQL